MRHTGFAVTTVHLVIVRSLDNIITFSESLQNDHEEVRHSSPGRYLCGQIRWPLCSIPIMSFSHSSMVGTSVKSLRDVTVQGTRLKRNSKHSSHTWVSNNQSAHSLSTIQGLGSSDCIFFLLPFGSCKSQRHPVESNKTIHYQRKCLYIVQILMCVAPWARLPGCKS